MLEQSHHILDIHHFVANIKNRYHLICTIQILLLPNAQRKRRGLIDRPLHLIYMPVGSEQGRIGDSDIRTDILHFLGIPCREGIIVSVGNKNSIRTHRFKIIACHFNCSSTV